MLLLVHTLSYKFAHVGVKDATFVVANELTMTSSDYNFLEEEFKNRQVKSGSVLISEPFLHDDNFSRTVILINEHNEKGSFGLILNRPLGKNLSDVVEGFGEVPIPLYSGGPVDLDTLHVIHTIGPQVPGSVLISEKLFWGGDIEYLRTLAANGNLDPQAVKFFIGYSGWMSNQLDAEIKVKSWVVTTLTPEEIFNLPPEDMWRSCLESLGGKFKEWLNFPVDPILN